MGREPGECRFRAESRPNPKCNMDHSQAASIHPQAQLHGLKRSNSLNPLFVEGPAMNPTMNMAVAAGARLRSDAADATTAAPTERPVTWHVDDVPWTPLTGLFINKPGYKTVVDAAFSRPSIVVGKIVPRRTASDGLRDREWVKAWRQDEERGRSAWSRIRWRLSMLALVLAGDAMILGAVLLLTGVAKF